MEDRFVPSGVDKQTWIGFEERIQKRRFRALIEAAESAIDSRDAAAALIALNEAGEIRPDDPVVARLAARAASMSELVPPTRRGFRIEPRTFGAIALFLGGMSLLVGLDWMRPALPSRSLTPVTSPPAVTDAGPASVVAPPETTPAYSFARSADVAGVVDEESIPVGSTGLVSGSASELTSLSTPEVPRPSETPAAHPVFPAASTESIAPPSGEIPDNYVAPQTRRITPVAIEASRPTPSPTLAPVQSSTTLEAKNSSSSMPLSNVARQPAAIATMTDVSAPVAATRTAGDETRINQVLGQYARAYGQLDAGAARAVWPTVDERALARAFAGLASQDVSFDSCDIDVHGATANASCRGRASYVGKVGSRESRTEPRQWRFELRRDGEAWKIESAEAKRVAY